MADAVATAIARNLVGVAARSLIEGVKDLRRARPIELLRDKPHRRIYKLDISPDDEEEELQEIYDSVPRFGPIYSSGDDSLMWTGKEEAWQHVLRKSPAQPSVTIRQYLLTIEAIEEAAMDTYADGAVDHLTNYQFRWMMIRDGCFFLQLALFALGGSEQLDHPPHDLIFGQHRNTKIVIKRWIKSMFFVGNQIPLLVLRQLINQPFFQTVLLGGQWDPPSDPFRRALFHFLLLPALPTTPQLQYVFPKLGLNSRSDFLNQRQPTDLLHGLQLLVIGPETGRSQDDDGDGDRDLEAGDTELLGDSSTLPSATELKQAGIKFKSDKKIGCRGIKFTTNMFCALLTLPTLTIDDDTHLMFRYLKNYEITQLSSNNRDVCSYLQFLSELIRTPDDAKLLASRGIIKASPKQRDNLPAMLKKLASGEVNQNLRLVRLRIDGYSKPPWEVIRNFLSIVLLLTLVQTVYTVLGYYKQ